MDAPRDFAAWLTAHEHLDPKYGWIYRYHSRSDAHSIALCKLVLKDIIDACQPLREHAIAATFVSPLRQKSENLYISQHKQPRAAERMVNHLRGLPIRDCVDDTGFDAYATIVVDCDNQGPVTLWTQPPAPQPGDRDHYDTFITRVAESYAKRFGRII